MEYKKMRPVSEQPMKDGAANKEGETENFTAEDFLTAGQEENLAETDFMAADQEDGGLGNDGLGNDGLEESGLEDIYGVYMEEIAAIPACSEEENRKLLEEIRRGNKDARNRLVEGNLKKALFFIQDYLNQGVPMVDLIQEASVELMLLADEGFDGGFEKLLESRIRVRMEEIIKEQKAERNASEEIVSRVNLLQEISAKMAAELGREATALELSERMQITEDEVKELMKTAMDALKLSEINVSLQS